MASGIHRDIAFALADEVADQGLCLLQCMSSVMAAGSTGESGRGAKRIL
jgi:hypothetical protein